MARMTENWLPVVGLEQTYEVSDLGRVRSKPRTVNKGGHKRRDGTSVTGVMGGSLLKPHLSARGYWAVYLTTPKGQRQRAIHVMVCQAFVGPQPENAVCRHLNDNRDENQHSNLAWGTRSENAQDAIRNGRMPCRERHGRAKLTSESVAAIVRAWKEGARPIDLAAIYGVSDSHIGNLVRGKRWKPELNPI